MPPLTTYLSDFQSSCTAFKVYIANGIPPGLLKVERIPSFLCLTFSVLAGWGQSSQARVSCQMSTSSLSSHSRMTASVTAGMGTTWMSTQPSLRNTTRWRWPRGSWRRRNFKISFSLGSSPRELRRFAPDPLTCTSALAADCQWMLYDHLLRDWMQNCTLKNFPWTFDIWERGSYIC